MTLHATCRDNSDVAVVDFSGRITLGEGSALLRDTIRNLTSIGKKKILLNLADVDYIDSAGIGELVGAYTTVANAANCAPASSAVCTAVAPAATASPKTMIVNSPYRSLMCSGCHDVPRPPHSAQAGTSMSASASTGNAT